MVSNDKSKLISLKESELKYRHMISEAFDAIFSIDIDSGQILEANKKAVELTGYSTNELQALYVWELHPTDEIEQAKELFHKVRTAGGGLRSNMHFQKKNGSLLDIDIAATVIEYSGIKVIQRICRDVTKRRQQEEQNAYLRQYYESILDMMPIGLGVKKNVDNTVEIEFQNKRLREIFHTQPLRENECCWSKENLQREFKGKITTDKDGVSVEEVIYPDNHIYQFKSRCFRDDHDNVQRELKIIQDVTKQRELEQALKQSNETLEEKVEQRTRELIQSEKMAALGNLVAGVAHEINTPLGALKSNNDLFMRFFSKIKSIVPLDQFSELEKYFLSIDKLNEVNREAAERIIKIVKSLRDFARLDQAEKDNVDLREGIESTLTLVYHEFKNRIEIIREFQEIPKLNCYPNQLNQVFMNLLVNASQAIEGKGMIVIRIYQEQGKIMIEIEDNGKGMPEDTIKKIFDPGFTTKGVGVGTGLGLSIVHQIIENHNGTIGVTSQQGKGTSFKIALPL